MQLFQYWNIGQKRTGCALVLHLCPSHNPISQTSAHTYWDCVPSLSTISEHTSLTVEQEIIELRAAPLDQCSGWYIGFLGV